MKLPFKKLRTADRGQAILIIALAMVGLVAFVGMMTDGGVMFIEYGKLKRGIDAAAIASAQQFREGFTGADLASAAQNFLTLNDSRADNINIYRCGKTKNADGTMTALPVDGNGFLLGSDGLADGTKPDDTLCPNPETDPLRKLVRVEAEKWVNFGFLRVIGLPGMTIRADSVGEAASIDLVLIIDTSASMSYETGGDPNFPDSTLDDPSVCNFSATDPCEPLNKVKGVATDFIDTMFFPYDRVSVVAFTGQAEDAGAAVTRDHVTVIPLSDNKTTVTNAIASLKVYQPADCDFAGSPASPAQGPCLNYDINGVFIGLDCPLLRYGADLIQNSGDEVYDPSSCNSSNIGGALYRGATEFTREPVRSDAFWVIIMLAGGPANATDADAPSFLYGYCPPTTWNVTVVDVDGDGDKDSADFAQTNPNCRDWDNSTRHGNGDANYDADDYARDQADFVADPVNGQGITVFTIGLGNLITNAPKGAPDSAESLLTYVAVTAGGVTANHGFYKWAEDPNALDEIFTQIADNIRTRIAK
ncbi:MAG: hypothetical protein DCC56_12855 [Anaerolineae bacterium]|nr:MAG: hypothetical protein DCC56_12855 [Anaerolineae bacterium]WKZ42996.1 MAG: hypothetical protein QY302_12920 [Anaerolineales bacterium]